MPTHMEILSTVERYADTHGDFPPTEIVTHPPGVYALHDERSTAPATPPHTSATGRPTHTVSRPTADTCKGTSPSFQSPVERDADTHGDFPPTEIVTHPPGVDMQDSAHQPATAAPNDHSVSGMSPLQMASPRTGTPQPQTKDATPGSSSADRAYALADNAVPPAPAVDAWLLKLADKMAGPPLRQGVLVRS